MRIVIAIEGGNVQGVYIEKGEGKPQVIIADYDNIEAGDNFDGKPWAEPLVERISTKKMNKLIENIKSNNVDAPDPQDTVE